jgi:hypothetical protein
MVKYYIQEEKKKTVHFWQLQQHVAATPHATV